MKYYFDLTLLSSTDFSVNFLWSKLYQFLHLEFVALEKSEKNEVATSFPEFDEAKNALGNKLRILSENTSVIDAIREKIKSRFSGYTHCTEVRLVPSSVNKFVVYKRVRPGITPAKLRRLALRKSKRENLSLCEVESKYEALLEEKSKTNIKDPFIRMSSLSSGKNFCLFIRKQNVKEMISEKFNTYGLGSAVPEF